MQPEFTDLLVYALQTEPAEVIVKDNLRLTVSMAAMFGPGDLIKRLAGVAKDLLRSTSSTSFL